MTLSNTAEGTYHHGDLRRALLDSAAAILSESGRWDFSLREVARRAGVSHNAPYRHFADKEALLAAIGVSGFEALRAETARAAAAQSDPTATLRALGQAYIRFGLANPALYRLMFGQALPSGTMRPPALRNAIEEARAALREVVLWGAQTGTFTLDPNDADDITATVVAAWSLVHGFTSLTIDRAMEREIERDTPIDWAARTIDRFIAGLLKP